MEDYRIWGWVVLRTGLLCELMGKGHQDAYLCPLKLVGNLSEFLESTEPMVEKAL